MKSPLPLDSINTDQLLFMAKNLFKEYKVNLSRINDCLDEFTTFTLSKGNKTELYHWFELATVHIPERLYSLRQLTLFNVNLLRQISDGENIIDLLWKDFKKLKR